MKDVVHVIYKIITDKRQNNKNVNKAKSTLSDCPF